jgi:chemotaxis protein histidine kinase CheA
MAHDVFICYASQDQAVAENVCKHIEDTGAFCWIAPRNVPAGKWGGAIMEAVAQSHIMVLVFSASSNNSANCLSEVHAAFSKNVKIIPLRIDDTEPSEDMSYYLQTFHWMDARTPPLEKHLQELVSRVKTELTQAAAKEKARQEAEAAKEKARREAEEARKAQEAAAQAMRQRKPLRSRKGRRRQPRERQPGESSRKRKRPRKKPPRPGKKQKRHARRPSESLRRLGRPRRRLLRPRKKRRKPPGSTPSRKRKRRRGPGVRLRKRKRPRKRPPGLNKQ